MSTVRAVEVITGDNLRLEGRLRTPDGPVLGVAVLAHPHPAFGGNMDVWLLPTIGQRLAADGWSVLRVNFRGVGGSAGEQTGGREEHLDLEAALAALREAAPSGVPAAAVGWSFGAMMALRLGRALDAWVGVAPPTRSLEQAALTGPLLPDVPPPRRSVIVGAHDQFFPPETVEVLQPDEVHVVADTDHFFFDRDPEIAELVARCLAPLLAPARQPAAPALGARYTVRITPDDVGERVSVRHRLGADDSHEVSDVVGHLEAWADGELHVRRRSGELRTVAEETLLAGKVLPPTQRSVH